MGGRIKIFEIALGTPIAQHGFLDRANDQLTVGEEVLASVYKKQKSMMTLNQLNHLNQRMGSHGVTVVELAAALVVAAILVGAAVPILMTGVENARFNAAVREVASDVRLARAEAVATGWQYRIRARDRYRCSCPTSRRPALQP